MSSEERGEERMEAESSWKNGIRAIVGAVIIQLYFGKIKLILNNNPSISSSYFLVDKCTMISLM